MTFSVIIPTYNGAHKILTALRALERQTKQPDEVIVVIDGSTDNTEMILRDASLSLRNFRVISQQNQGRAGVRNSGARQATGDILVFLDDDMKPEPAWLASHMDHHRMNPDTILTSVAIDLYEGGMTDFQQFKLSISRKWAAELDDYDQKAIPAAKVFITAANFSVPRSIFLSLNGFNTILNDGEDYDLAIRATRKGIPIFYRKEAFGWHLEQSSCAYTIRRNRNYYEAGKILLDANPEIYGPIFGHRREEPKTLKAKLFRFFAQKFWIDTIDANRWTWLPRSARYKLYDIVLTANATLYPDAVKL